MKRRHWMLGKVVLVCLLGTVCASASNSDSQGFLPAAASLAGNPASSHAASVTAQSAVKPGKSRRKQVAQANLASFSGGVVQEIRATSELVEEGAAKAGTSDSWLVMLAALGLVVLQLRRKHKSLPQRRIAPYA
jgi:hypothetical protein